MNRKTVFFLGAAIVLIGVVSYVWFFVYNKPHRDIEFAEPDFDMQAEQLISLFQENDSAAHRKLDDKVVRFHGTLSSKESADTTVTLIFDTGEDFIITAQMLPKYKAEAESFSAGSEIVLKGLYNGMIPGDADFGLPAAIVFNKCSPQK